MMHVVKLGTSTKGRPKLFVDGFGFNFERQTRTHHSWICDKSYIIVNKKKKRVCSARLKTTVTDGDHTPESYPEHDHGPDELAFEINDCRNTVKCK